MDWIFTTAIISILLVELVFLVWLSAIYSILILVFALPVLFVLATLLRGSDV